MSKDCNDPNESLFLQVIQLNYIVTEEESLTLTDIFVRLEEFFSSFYVDFLPSRSVRERALFR